jgi:hypothetical protein
MAHACATPSLRAFVWSSFVRTTVFTSAPLASCARKSALSICTLHALPPSQQSCIQSICLRPLPSKSRSKHEIDSNPPTPSALDERGCGGRCNNGWHYADIASRVTLGGDSLRKGIVVVVRHRMDENWVYPSLP